jgi:hypothetical protein
VNKSTGLLMPQSWNRYAFVINNPLTYIDPSGTIWVRNNQNGKIYWIPDNQWGNASKQTYNNGKTLYTPLKSSEMEFDSKKGRVRLDPRGPTNDNPSGYTIIGPNRGSGAGAMAIGAVAVSQADSPVPGPGDVIAVGLLAVALYSWATYDVMDLPEILTVPPVTSPGPITDPHIYAKGGKQNIKNEWNEAAVREVGNDVAKQIQWLEEQYKNETDPQVQQKIKTAQKAIGGRKSSGGDGNND